MKTQYLEYYMDIKISRCSHQTLCVLGRHDPCVCPRAVPIAEAMLALVLADHLLRQRLARA